MIVKLKNIAYTRAFSVAAPLLLVASLTACQDQSFTRFNSVPEATITSHADASEVYEGYAVAMRGTASDPDHGTTDLTALWYLGTELICEQADLPSSGETSCDMVFDPQNPTVTLEVRDPEGAAGVQQLDLSVIPTDAPVAEIVGPSLSDLHYSGYPVAFEGLVADAEDAPESLIAWWESSQDGTLVVDAEPTDAGEVLGHGYLTEGDHVIKLYVMDTTGKTGSTSVMIQVGPENTAPSCSITQPKSSESFEQGTDVTFEASVSDPDISADRIGITWSSDKDGELGTSVANSEGEVVFSTNQLSVTTHTITLTGQDEIGSSCSDHVVVTIAEALALDVQSPAEGDVYNQGDMITFVADISENERSLTAIEFNWESSIDGVLSTQGADSTGVAQFTRDDLSPGTHTLTVTANDSTGIYAQGLINFTVNALPTEPIVSLGPVAAGTGDDLVVSIDTASTDADGDPITYSYTWFQNGVVSSASTSASLAASNTAKGEAWSVTVTPNDGYADGMAGEALITVGNTAPTVASATLNPDPAHTGDTLECTAGTTADADGDTVSLVYSWDVSGTVVSETTDSLSSAWFGNGDDVTCVVTPFDGTDSGVAIESNTVIIENSAPEISSVSVSPNPADATDTLTCSWSGFSDADGDADASTVEWTINGAAAGTDTTLSGLFVGGDTVACTVTPYDGSETGTPMSDAIEIENAAPELASVAITPTEVYEGDTLTCTPGTATDADGDIVTFSYAWSVDGVVTGHVGTTLTSSWFNRDQTVVCSVTPNDGVVDGSVVDSNPVTVLNTVPEMTAVSMTPTSPSTDDTLEAVVSTTDADGDDVDVSYAWYVEGALVSTASDSLNGTYFDYGETIYVVATPNDGTDDGAAVASTSVTIGNSTPEISAVSISPNPALVGYTLTCSWTGFVDADGDADESLIEWSINGSVVGTATTLSSGFVGGDTVSCEVTPYDGITLGASVSTSVVIENSAPTIDAVSITPTDAKTDDTLLCAWSGFDDADGDADQSWAAWTINGVSAGTGTVLSSGYVHGDVVTCTVTPDDGSDEGVVVSASLTINNTAPSVATASISPATASATDVLSCAWTGFSDADGESDASTATWTVNGVTAGSGTTLASGYVHGDVVTCTVTPNDGTDTGAAVADSIVIENSAPSISAVSIAPYPAVADDILACEWTGFTDADGEDDFSTVAWTINGVSAGTGTTLVSGYGRGDVVGCTVTPYDGNDYGTAVTETTTISNTAPSVDAVSILPNPAVAGDALTCAWTGFSDADGDADSSSSVWAVNGVNMGSSTTLSSGFSGGDVVTCTVTPNDGYDAGEPVESSITIDNTAPEITAVAILPLAPSVGDTLSCSWTGFSDADGDADQSTVSWLVGGVTAGTGTTLSSGFSGGEMVTCLVTPYDGRDYGDVVSAAVTINNTAPELDAVTLTPDTAFEGDTLTCTPGTATDADGDTISFGYAWRVSSASVGVTGSTLSSSHFERGDDVYCIVTPTDGAADGASVVSNVVVIENTAPELSGVAIAPNPAQADDTLTCSASTATDADGDALSYSYSWTVDGSTVAFTSTLDASYTARGDSIVCAMTATDGSTTSDTVSSDAVTIENSAPMIMSVALSPSSIATSDTVNVLVTSADADGDSVSYAYNWTVDGVSIPAASGATLDGSLWFDKGQTVVVTVTPNDGFEDGVSEASAGVTVGNTAPGTPVVAIDPTHPREGEDDLICAIDVPAIDVDGDSLDYVFSWEVDGVSYTATDSTDHTGDTVLAEDLSDGETWTCIVHANDGDDDGASTDASAVVLNAFDGWASSKMSLGAATWSFVGENARDNSGYSVAGVGDVDGDGFDDLLIGANGEDSGGSGAGAAYLIYGDTLVGGSGEMDLSVADVMLIGESSNDNAGRLVSWLGDVDGDSLDDVLISAFANDDGGMESGKTYIVSGATLAGDSEIDLADADYSYMGESMYDYSGQSAAGLGDIDGDGLADFVVGAYGNDENGASSGSAYVILADSLGSSSAGLGSADYQLLGESGSDYAGYSVAGPGDVDGDGLADVLVGAYRNGSTATLAGKAYLVVADDLTSSRFYLSGASSAWTGEGANDYLGYIVSSAGDVDGDEQADIMIGAYSNDDSAADAGKSYVMLGSSLTSGTSSVSVADYQFYGESTADHAGQWLGSAGDVDGDGLGDLVFGAPASDTWYGNGGKTYLTLATSIMLGDNDLADADYQFMGESSSDYTGWSAKGVGDINADGLADFVSCSTGNDDGGTGAGKTYLFLAP